MQIRRRRRVLRAGAGVAVAALIAGCSATGSSSGSSSGTVVAKGTTLVIYLSAPPAADPVQKQVLQAEQLACSQLTGSISGTSLSTRCETASGAELSDNARTAIQNESAIAYIGELQPGDSEQTLGITNTLDLPQVSPTDTAVELTQPVSAVPGSPGNFYEASGTYGHTFIRITPTSAQEATAQVDEMKRMGIRTIFVTGDSSDYGKALQAAVRSDAAAQGIKVNNSEAAVNAIFWGGNSASAADDYAAHASSTATSTKLFLPSALAGVNFASSGWSSFRAVYVSQPGAGATAEKSFVSAFRSHYGAAPGPQAAFGFAAVQAVVHALHAAGSSATSRTTVLRDLRKLSGLSTAVGPVSIDSAGDSSLGPADFVFSRLRAGSLVALGVKAG